LLTNVHSELYRYVIDTELQLSGKKRLKIPKGQSESIFGVAYFVFFHAWQNKITSFMTDYYQSNSNESGRFGALKFNSTHHFFRNAFTKSGSLRFSQFCGCWLILSVYIIMSFDFPFVRLFGVRWFCYYPYL
jgi:hypothetical protein